MPRNKNKGSRRAVFFSSYPLTLDPHMLYEYTAYMRSKTADGLEGFLYKLIPYQYMSSIAFAIDPLAEFRNPLGKISPRVRSRVRILRSLLHESSIVYGTKINEGYNTLRVAGHDTSYMQLLSHLDLSQARVKLPQQDISDTSLDTISKLRPPGSELGEFELFKSELQSSPREYHIYNQTDIVNQIDPQPWPPQRSSSTSRIDRHVSPMAATLSSSTSDLLKADAMATANGLIDSNLLNMLKYTDPNTPQYTLFRNIVELKDVSRSVISLQQTALDLYKLGKTLNVEKVSKLVHNLQVSLKHIPDEYLSYTFGWRQLYNDTMSLLTSPAKVAKRINYLILRNGKDSSHRVKRDIVLPNLVVPSGFNYSFGSVAEETNPTTRHRVERSAQLRLVVNSNFEFPPADLPEFGNRKFLELMGVRPTLMDLYNLTPWTWLFDWFTGFGDYLQIVMKINSDPNLVNWGLITCKVTGELITDMQSEINQTRSMKVNTAAAVVQLSKTRMTHQSRYPYEYLIRKSVSSAQPSIKTFADPSTLSGYQQSVLGALIAQRLKFSR